MKKSIVVLICILITLVSCNNEIEDNNVYIGNQNTDNETTDNETELQSVLFVNNSSYQIIISSINSSFDSFSLNSGNSYTLEYDTDYSFNFTNNSEVEYTTTNNEIVFSDIYQNYLTEYRYSILINNLSYESRKITKYVIEDNLSKLSVKNGDYWEGVTGATYTRFTIEWNTNNVVATIWLHLDGTLWASHCSYNKN